MSNLKISTLLAPSLSPGTLVQHSPPRASAPQAEHSVSIPTEQLLSKSGKAGSAQARLELISQIAVPRQIASSEQVKQAVETAIERSFARVPTRAGESRHQLNQRLQAAPSDGGPTLNKQVHYDGSDVVIIAFEGTGAFDPRCAPIMQEAAEILQQQGLHSQPDKAAIHAQLSESLSKREGKAINWSGLAVGPLSTLLDNPELAARTQWLSFPSEEFEGLAGMEALKNVSLKQVLSEAVLSNEGETPGINNALHALRNIQAQALAQGKNPQFVIVSHSSGGRSAVKFLEKAKGIHDLNGQPLKFPLVMTIDPVREAHEALLEAGKELLYKGTEHNLNRLRAVADYIPFVDTKPQKVYPPLVRHRSQPESLYAPGNVETFLSFYQLKDTEGLKLESPKFGIQGSPVAGAVNQEIKDVGSSGHGQIAYNPKVVRTFEQQLRAVLTDKP